jgi:glycine/D-amino acid oxidase-like deaminating enzyme/nitrite reductase/ring-hydroxylating ferredoxin subunit
MDATAERTRSVWMDTQVAGGVPLDQDEHADVVVVGAGLAGLSAAYEITKAGRSVVVLDAGPIGGGMTARTTGHVSSELDDLYHELVSMRGLEDARLCYRSMQAAVDRLGEIAEAEGIDCDYRRLDGYLFLAPGDDPEILLREIDACHQVGFAGVIWVDKAPIPGVDTGRALRFPNQARFHPLKYLDGLARCVRRDGGRLYAETRVKAVEEVTGGEVVVTTESGRTIRAASAVVATNTPINDRVAIHTKQAPYRTYVVTGRVPKGAVEDALYWDTLDAYHYVRLQPGPGNAGHDYLIVGSEDHKTGHANDGEERFAKLEAWTRQHFPQVQDFPYRWSGQVMEPVDYLAFIGRNHNNDEVYIATGDSGEGMTNGIIAGILLRDLVLGRENEWARIYDPRRTTLKAALETMRENLDVAANYRDYVTPGDVSSAEDLKPGQGAVIRQGLGKVAAYRDEAGVLHLRSAVCPHLGCVVRWNALERTWDCPCHGSHFATDGTPLQGPSTAPLAAVEG